MSEVVVRTSRKDSRPKIERALKEALGKEETKVSFEKSTGKARSSLTAQVVSDPSACQATTRAVAGVLSRYSRGKSVLVYCIR